jgi:hypothetical protein
MSVGVVTFHNARQSGITVSQLGSGVNDHLGFFGLAGTTAAIQILSYNDTTFIVDSDGDVPAYLGSESGKMLNAKYISDTEVELSGVGTKLLTDVNVFDANALVNPPEFPNQSSGTLLIRYFASGVREVNTFNAKLWAYDNAGGLNDAPPDVTVKAFEANASGQWYNAAHSGVWRTISGEPNALFFTDHSNANSWLAANEHIWVAFITVRPDSVGILDSWNLAVSLQFA